jgi:hypothetical protein
MSHQVVKNHEVLNQQQQQFKIMQLCTFTRLLACSTCRKDTRVLYRGTGQMAAKVSNICTAQQQFTGPLPATWGQLSRTQTPTCQAVVCYVQLLQVAQLAPTGRQWTIELQKATAAAAAAAAAALSVKGNTVNMHVMSPKSSSSKWLNWPQPTRPY